MFHFISFALTIGQGKYIYKRGKVKEKSAKNQRILFSIFCGNPVILLSDYLQKIKSWVPTNYFLYGIFDHGWSEFQLKYWCPCFLSAKLKCQILLQGISNTTNIITYHAMTIEKSENGKAPWFSLTFPLYLKWL